MEKSDEEHFEIFNTQSLYRTIEFAFVLRAAANIPGVNLLFALSTYEVAWKQMVKKQGACYSI